MSLTVAESLRLGGIYSTLLRFSHLLFSVLLLPSHRLFRVSWFCDFYSVFLVSQTIFPTGNSSTDFNLGSPPLANAGATFQDIYSGADVPYLIAIWAAISE